MLSLIRSEAPEPRAGGFEGLLETTIPGVALDYPSMRFDESLLRSRSGVNAWALAQEAVTAPGIAVLERMFDGFGRPRRLPGQHLFEFHQFQGKLFQVPLFFPGTGPHQVMVPLLGKAST